jgi:hypothetical protein
MERCSWDKPPSSQVGGTGSEVSTSSTAPETQPKGILWAEWGEEEDGHVVRVVSLMDIKHHLKGVSSFTDGKIEVQKREATC